MSETSATQSMSGGASGGFMTKATDFAELLLHIVHDYLSHIFLLATRLYIGWIFFKSGYLSFSPWDNTIFLYEYEYMPNITANLGYDISFIPVNVMAIGGVTAELVFSVLLFVGLFTRFAALGLLMVTVVIQLTYPQFGGTHYAWMFILGLLIARGGGALTLDNVLGPRFGFSKR